MLRAARFAAKLGFRLHPDTEAPIAGLAPLLRDIPAARLFEEVLKLFLGGCAVQTFELLRHYGLFEPLFQQTERSLAHEEKGFPITFVARALENTDRRIAEGKPVTPAFLFAALLWEPVRNSAARLVAEGTAEPVAIQEAADEVLARQTERVAIPRRFSVPMREIWQLQARLANPSGRRAWRDAAHPRFRAGYDFLVLRAEAGEIDPAAAQWWTRFQEVDHSEQQGMVEQSAPPRRKPRRRHRRRKPSGTPSEGA
jgi:poly(A) polymerase